MCAVNRFLKRCRDAQFVGLMKSARKMLRNRIIEQDLWDSLFSIYYPVVIVLRKDLYIFGSYIEDTGSTVGISMGCIYLYTEGLNRIVL